MQLIDTHTHIYLPEFDGDRVNAVQRAKDNNVVKLLMPNIDVHSVEAMLSVEKQFPEICHSMIGLHPTSVKEDSEKQLNELESILNIGRFVAIGEIGIDLYWDRTFINEQIVAFKRQIVLALSANLPVVIHSREAFPEIFSAMRDFEGSGIKGVFHAFTGTLSDAEKAIGMGFKLGVGGIVTFKNSGLGKIVRETGLQHIITETDSPYLAPVPYRGKRNESSYISIIIRKLAEIFDIEEEEAASVTYRNAIELFSLE
jgi:TatD DNase family protein